MLSSFALFWKASRASWIAFLLAVLFIAFLKNKKLVLYLLIFLIIIGIFLPAPIKIRGMALFTPAAWMTRIELWKGAVGIGEDFPIFGAGLGMYEKLLYDYAPAGGYSEGRIHLHAHSTYLEILSETGLIGLIAFLWIFVIFFKKSISAIKHDNSDLKIIRLGLTGSILATLIFANATSIIIVGLQDAVIFWFVFGIALGYIDLNPSRVSCKNM